MMPTNNDDELTQKLFKKHLPDMNTIWILCVLVPLQKNSFKISKSNQSIKYKLLMNIKWMNKKISILKLIIY